MDGRRHSVDLPISKTLVALRRVRSLRDPSTNSMSKLSTMIDNMNWDTNSCHGISLKLENGYDRTSLSNGRLLESKALDTCCEDEEVTTKDLDLHKPAAVGNPNVPSQMHSGLLARNPDSATSVALETEQEAADHRLEVAGMTLDHHVEGGGSNHGSNVASPAVGGQNSSRPRHKCKLRNHVRSPGSMSDLVSRNGSRCACPGDSLLDGTTPSTSLFPNDELEYENRSYRGCGLSYCWSGTPRRRVSSLFSDEDSYPLLSGEIGITDISEQSRSWKNSNNELVPYSESPRSLSQKFRPKSFSELVGQSVVARSLSGAISKGRITSLYLFHGPRGTGKSSASKIFAGALNCLSLAEHRPCGLCQECVLFFAGRSRDVKEVDSVRINSSNRIRSLIKNATIPPVSSRFKVFIVDECQLLRTDTWATLLSNFERFSRHAVFVLITPDIDKVPRNALARSQRYHFPKIKDVDVSSRLRKICIEEGLEFEQVALDFIATKSNGSVRDAEMMLDQLSLLSKQVTMTLAYELIGTVSDDELLNLLDLALSADTSNTVKRARELMRSRIDPMQLISQLANIIMDILAGKCSDESSEARRNFLLKHSSEMDMQKLRNALNILSESEKQLRTSKNQTTWLTVALLQLNSMDSSLSDINEPRMSHRAVNCRDGDCCSSSSTGERSKHHITSDCGCNEMHRVGVQEDDVRNLESIWTRATEICESSSLRNFLRRRGKLSSVCVKKGLAVAQLEFSHPNYASKAEKSWKSIASSLQSVLGQNVEIRISYTPMPYAKMKRSSFGFFNCSRRMQGRSQSLTRSGSDPSDISNFTSDKAMIGERSNSVCSPGGCQSHHAALHVCSHRRDITSTIRNSDGNALSTGTGTPYRCSQDHRCSQDGSGVISEPYLGIDSCRGGRGLSLQKCKILTIQEAGVDHNHPAHGTNQPSSDSSEMVCFKIQHQNNNHPASPIQREASFDAYICTDYPYIMCNGSNDDAISSRQEEGSVGSSKVHCWRTPPFSAKKSWQTKSQRQRSHLVEWVLPCAAAK